MQITLQSEFGIVARSQAETPSRVLKEGDTFLLFDRAGDVNAQPIGDQGLYRGDTRFVSRWTLRLNGEPPLLLGSEITSANDRCIIDLTNPDQVSGDEVVLPKGSLHLRRTRFLLDGVVYERLALTSYAAGPVTTRARPAAGFSRSSQRVRLRFGRRFAHGMTLASLPASA